MGVTVKSKRHSIDLGCGGFHRLRTKVAEIQGGDVYDLYSRLMYVLRDKDELEKYNKELNDLAAKYKGELNYLLDFLYMSDVSGRLHWKKCAKLYKLIEFYDDNILYGYAGRPDCAKFKDFKQIIKDVMEDKGYLIWY